MTNLYSVPSFRPCIVTFLYSRSFCDGLNDTECPQGWSHWPLLRPDEHLLHSTSYRTSSSDDFGGCHSNLTEVSVLSWNLRFSTGKGTPKTECNRYILISVLTCTKVFLHSYFFHIQQGSHKGLGIKTLRVIHTSVLYMYYQFVFMVSWSQRICNASLTALNYSSQSNVLFLDGRLKSHVSCGSVCLIIPPPPTQLHSP